MLSLTVKEAAAMQRAFDLNGPKDERGADWWRCQEQPWRDIASALVFHTAPTGRA